MEILRDARVGIVWAVEFSARVVVGGNAKARTARNGKKPENKTAPRCTMAVQKQLSSHRWKEMVPGNRARIDSRAHPGRPKPEVPSTPYKVAPMQVCAAQFGPQAICRKRCGRNKRRVAANSPWKDRRRADSRAVEMRPADVEPGDGRHFRIRPRINRRW